MEILCLPLWQHIDKVFKHKELQQQLMDAKLQRITEMMKEVEEKQQRERDFVSTHSAQVHCPHVPAGAWLHYCEHAALSGGNTSSNWEEKACVYEKTYDLYSTCDVPAAEGCYGVQTQMWADEGTGSPAEAAGKHTHHSADWKDWHTIWGHSLYKRQWLIRVCIMSNSKIF